MGPYVAAPEDIAIINASAAKPRLSVNGLEEEMFIGLVADELTMPVARTISVDGELTVFFETGPIAAGITGAGIGEGTAGSMFDKDGGGVL